MSESPSIARVLIVAKVGTVSGRQMARELGDWLIQHGVDVDYESDTAQALGLPAGMPRDKISENIDLALVAGGDGTLLSVAREVAPLGIPILGVNLGTLGFLTELPADERFSGLEAMLAGNYTVEERQTLRVRYSTEGSKPKQYALLNDAVITKSALARMIDLAVRIDGESVVSYKSDGLIVATPTGSTAYSLSAGGPILDPRMRAFVIAPICPHTMNLRPLVVPGDVQIEVSVRSADEEAFLTLDGQLGFPVEDGDRLTIDDHPNPVRLVRVAQRGFFEVLRRKLRWGER